MTKQEHKLYYFVWRGMIKRCYEPTAHTFKYYGARGIKVCKRWRESVENFRDDMYPRPAGYQLDRIDNGLGYSPENCRWVTTKQQRANRRDVKWITFNGETKLLTEWGKEFRVSEAALWYRLYVAKWSIEDALTVRINHGNRWR